MWENKDVSLGVGGTGLSGELLRAVVKVEKRQKEVARQKEENRWRGERRFGFKHLFGDNVFVIEIIHPWRRSWK